MAGSAKSSLNDEPISGINVTPLVDVMLVLLVIFMITAPAIYQSAIKVQLPKAKTGEQTKNTAFRFSLSGEGQLVWDRKPIGWKELETRLKAIGQNVTQQTAVINADQQTPHGTVVKLMDLLRRVGLTRFALNVDPN